MTLNRKQQLMQESLDRQLSPDAEQELDAFLNQDQEGADEYTRLKTTDDLLRTAPYERAPQRLALKIMARIAEAVREQQSTEQELSEMAEAIVNVALTTVTVATLPLLIGASWMMLNTHARQEVVEDVLARVTALVVLTIDIIQVMLEEAEAAYTEENPEVAMAILTMVPATLLLLVREVLGLDEIDDEE